MKVHDCICHLNACIYYISCFSLMKQMSWVMHLFLYKYIVCIVLSFSKETSETSEIQAKEFLLMPHGNYLTAKISQIF